VNVASERQVAANRRNAQKSTGPRSAAGKKRASRNAYRHGLTAGVGPSGEWAGRIESLAHEIAGAGADPVVLELGRAAARAECRLAEIRRVRAALVTPISALANVQEAQFSHSDQINGVVSGTRTNAAPMELSLVPPAAMLPSSQSERLTHAVHEALPQLLKLDQYERRAGARRDHAVFEIFARKLLRA
jgi:hypothetical protein